MSDVYLVHHGVKGMKWGVRKQITSSTSGQVQTGKKQLSDKKKKALKVGAAVVATGLAGYGVYKLSKISKSKSTTDLAKDWIDEYKFKEFKIDEFKPKTFDPVNNNPYTNELKSWTKSVATNTNPKPKSLDKFDFVEQVAKKADGSTVKMKVPTDKHGYADSFAKQMSRKPGDYDYYYKYMRNKIG